MFDAHNHLQFVEFDADRDAVLAAAATAGVTGMVLAGYDAGRESTAAELARQPGIGATAGLHPWAVADCDLDAELARLAALDFSPFCALGELGLDWVRATTAEQRSNQLWAFRAQLALARELNLPVVLHCVGAYDDLIGWLRRDGLPARGGMVHSFWGSAVHVHRMVDLGLHLSVGTQITRARRSGLVRGLVDVGTRWLLVETDAPSRPPRGVETGRNEPGFLGHVVDALADCLGLDPHVVASATERNARALFEIEGVLGA